MTNYKELKIEDHLTSGEDIKGFLHESSLLKDGSPDDFSATLHALKIAARAMSRIDLAKKTGLNRETVRLFLQENSNPRTSTISKIVSGLGYRITLEPMDSPLKKGSSRRNLKRHANPSPKKLTNPR